ncbi:MAG: undecaprenyldiphospho-muramoylpentapeptide beta-N-acetylglucosaminyltransferase [Saprospiraceae bacterium]|nr:undecaprenyldiphospho-muramoylpentapeptide beta-N-acetylglucosaminyltransferase [Saprospiraceae bacterium]
MPRTLKIIISGGGTGGHIFPAIAIANAIKSKHPDADILFVGAKGRMEMEKVPKAGYKIEGLWISGFQRKLTLQNLLFPIKLLSSMAKARQIIRRFKPDVAVGVGGYASGPLLEMATRMGVPALIQEQNSYAGATNRLLSQKVQKICVAYDGMERYFPREKLVLTGNPVRKDLVDIQAMRGEALQYFMLDLNKKTLIIFGGSLGARTLNQAMAASTEWLQKRPDVQVLWQCGSLYVEQFKNCETAKLPNVKLNAFIDRMDLAYKMADVAIARAGALTVSELCLVGLPSILIPSPNVAEDHQTKNAMALVQKNAAILLKDSDAQAQMIAKALELLDDEVLKQELSTNIKQLAKPNAAEEIANEVLKLIPNQRL